MVLRDNVYGKFDIKEPVLIELLRAPSILRLKKISQYGVPDKYYHHKNYSRYEHSVGVMLLLRRLGATLEEQVAGLLHDISVLAFSHITDWVFSGGRDGIESYHDSIHEEFVKKTEIPKILKRYDFVLERILDEDNFSLLEKKIPDLCADRVDYALREFKYWLNPKIVGRCLESLINYNGEVVFNDQEVAFLFASGFLELQTKHWGGYEAVFRYHLFSRALEIALEKRVVNKKDFYKDEPFILSKVERADGEIKKILALLKEGDLKEIERNSGREVYKKFRYVDPKVISDGKSVKLSILNPKIKRLISRHREINRKRLTV